MPDIVITPAFHVSVSPDGSPTAAPIPVAPDVVNVISGFNALFAHHMGLLEGADAVFALTTVMLPVADTDPHPPVNGIV